MLSEENDQKVIRRLMSMPDHDLFEGLRGWSSFCQWCAGERRAVKRELLYCPTCDRGTS